MPAQISLFSDPDLTEKLEFVELNEVEIGLVGEGLAQQIFGSNTGDTGIRNVTVSVEGPGRDFIQLAAQDIDGDPAVWAARGEGIVIQENTMFPGEVFSFWMRPLYALEDREGVYDFEFVLGGVSVG